MYLHWYLKNCRKKSGKLSAGGWALLISPFRVFLATTGPTISRPWKNELGPITTDKNYKKHDKLSEFIEKKFLKKTVENIKRYTFVSNLNDLSWFMKPWMQQRILVYFWMWNEPKWRMDGHCYGTTRPFLNERISIKSTQRALKSAAYFERNRQTDSNKNITFSLGGSRCMTYFMTLKAMTYFRLLFVLIFISWYVSPYATQRNVDIYGANTDIIFQSQA